MFSKYLKNPVFIYIGLIFLVVFFQHGVQEGMYGSNPNRVFSIWKDELLARQQAGWKFAVYENELRNLYIIRKEAHERDVNNLVFDGLPGRTDAQLQQAALTNNPTRRLVVIDEGFFVVEVKNEGTNTMEEIKNGAIRAYASIKNEVLDKPVSPFNVTLEWLVPEIRAYRGDGGSSANIEEEWATGKRHIVWEGAKSGQGKNLFEGHGVLLDSVAGGDVRGKHGGGFSGDATGGPARGALAQEAGSSSKDFACSCKCDSAGSSIRDTSSEGFVG